MKDPVSVLKLSKAQGPQGLDTHLLMSSLQALGKMLTSLLYIGFWTRSKDDSVRS